MTEEMNFLELYEQYEKEAEVLVLDPGKHKLKVTSCTPKGKGLFPTYTPAEGPDAGKRVLCGVMSPGDSQKGKIAFMLMLSKFGLTKEFFAQKPTMKDVANALVGRVIEGELIIEAWNGENRNKLGFGIKLISAPPLPARAGVPSIPTASAPPVSEPAAATPPQAAPSFLPPQAPAASAVADGDEAF